MVSFLKVLNSLKSWQVLSQKSWKAKGHCFQKNQLYNGEGQSNGWDDIGTSCIAGKAFCIDEWNTAEALHQKG